MFYSYFFFNLQEIFENIVSLFHHWSRLLSIHKNNKQKKCKS